MFKDYYSDKIAKDAFNTKTGLFSKSFWNPPKKKIISKKKNCEFALPMKDGRLINMNCR